MPASRRLPTSVFTLVAVLVITLGAAWWVSAEPPAPPTVPRSEAANPVRLDLGNRRILTYVRGTRTAAESTSRCRSVRRLPYHRRLGPSVTDRNVPAPSTTSRFVRSTRCPTR